MEALRHHPVPHTSPLQAADAAVPVDVPNVDFIKGSAQEMDFESVFDLAFSNSALQWVKKLEEKANLFRWDYYRDKEGHMEHRTAALARFATDYASNYMGEAQSAGMFTRNCPACRLLTGPLPSSFQAIFCSFTETG